MVSVNALTDSWYMENFENQGPLVGPEVPMLRGGAHKNFTKNLWKYGILRFASGGLLDQIRLDREVDGSLSGYFDFFHVSE